MTNNPFTALLSPRAQLHYGDKPVRELLENFRVDSKHLTPVDKTKIEAIQQGIEAYIRKVDDKYQITSSRGAMAFCESLLSHKDQEEVLLILLDTKNYVIHHEMVFKGSLNSCINTPRELMRVVLRYPAAKFMIAHNHPSGSTEPSDADISSTYRIEEIGKLMGIPLLDHIIVGDNQTLSMTEENIISPARVAMA